MRDLHGLVERAAALVDQIAADLTVAGGVVRCGACRTEEPLGDVAARLREGWPSCCGVTMTWVTQRLLDEEKGASRGGPAS